MSANSFLENLTPYLPPLEGRSNFPGLLLDFNERTTKPSPKVITALQKIITRGALNRYPEYGALNSKISSYADVAEEEVMMTNGSDQGIELIIRSFSQEGDTLLIPAPSFAMFFQCAKSSGRKIISPLYPAPNFKFPFSEVLEKIDPSIRLIILCNPNNPTGTLIPLPEIEEILKKAAPAMVLVDEAYFEFSGITAASFLKQYENLIISRTFSKAFGLAGLRIGYLLSQKENILALRKVQGPYDVNSMAAAAAAATLEDIPDMNSYVREVMQEAKPLTETFFQTHGIPFAESAANFLSFVPKNAAATLSKLEEKGIRIRAPSGPNMNGILRVTIGTSADMAKFCDVYRKNCL
jgi:histidinol-phosphate aminotransferase